jgi:hypothetical protein
LAESTIKTTTTYFIIPTFITKMAAVVDQDYAFQARLNGGLAAVTMALAIHTLVMPFFNCRAVRSLDFLTTTIQLI